MRFLFTAVALSVLAASCGFNPNPKEGKLPCDHGCPSGYVCRGDNRCWRSNSPLTDGAIDGPAIALDVAARETASSAGMDGAQETGGGAGGAVGTGGAAGSVGTGGSGGAGGNSANVDAAQDAPESCVPETNHEMCVRLGKNCDSITGQDNCGHDRSIPSCGTCQAPLVCGSVSPNVCPVVCLFDQSKFEHCALGP